MRVAILHNIRSAHNVGSIFRTADGAGFDRLYLCGVTPSPTDRFGRINEKISKVSLGAEKTVQWRHYESTARCIATLRRQGFSVFAVEQDTHSMPYYQFCMPESLKAAFVFGNEVEGLPQPIVQKSDAILEIPLKGSKESLNVSVAFGIIAFHTLLTCG